MAKYQITAPDGSQYEVTAPDNATEAQVLDFAKAQWSAKPSNDEAVPRGTRESGLQTASRYANAVNRGALEGLGGLPAAVADVVAYPFRKATEYVSGETIPSYSELFRSGLTELGFTPPATSGEQMVGAISGGVSGGLSGGVGIGNLLSQSTRPVVQGVGDLLRSAPGVQAIAGGSAGLSGELARQAGAGQTGQMMAGLAGGLVGGGLASLASPRAQPLLSAADEAPALPAAGSQQAQLQVPQRAAAIASAQSERSPEYLRSVATLDQADIPLTSGQRSGTNFVKSTERTLSEVPYSGRPLQQFFEKQQQAFQKALLKMSGNNRGDTMVTRQTLQNTADDLSNDYVSALSGKTVSIADDEFLDGLGAIEAKHTQFVDDPSKTRVRQIVNGFLDESSKNGGKVSGEWYQQQRSLFARRAMKNTEVADLYGDLKGLLDDAFVRAAGPVKGNLDSRYARFKQLQAIFDRNGGPAASEGFISPVAVAREASGAPGGREWQDFTRAAAAVLPDRLGNSGTAQRNFVLGLAGGSVPAAMIEPSSLLLTAGGAGASRGLSSLLIRQPTYENPLLNPLPASLAGVIEQQGSR